MIKDSVLFALSSGFSFHCFIFIWKKNRLEVYCSVFLLFSRCSDHFICYSCIVYIGDSLGHVICLLNYFWLNILKCISTLYVHTSTINAPFRRVLISIYFTWKSLFHSHLCNNDIELLFNKCCNIIGLLQ
jgi:hypothetical protein